MNGHACCTLAPITISWGAFKIWLSHELHISHAVLHIHVGLAIFFAATVFLRRRPGSLLPLLIVLTLETANELADFLRYQVSGWPWGPSGTIEDVIDTMLWPTVITVLIRLMPGLWSAARKPLD